ncbi:hypothetical protein [Streptomyces sp. ME19-01-6]|uniref:hypothetical protein n=1 Tax=Streptomyces sp. ME19-01-6 TaxID=3028686 RepID=UPI0029AA69C6|nr:hypothetical protein [Streptomyces sp. ME19-01-6]MDX3227729.1 hypothetical protein [Streptomyces sp. ME19-01-6]
MARTAPVDAAHLLPACSPGVAAEWLPRLDPRIGVLHTLARTAPAAVAARLAADYRARDDQGRRRLAHRHRLLPLLWPNATPTPGCCSSNERPR